MVEGAMSIPTFAFVFWIILIGFIIYEIIKLYYSKAEVEERKNGSRETTLPGEEHQERREM